MICKSPIRRKRTKPRPGRLKGAALEKLRIDCWTRDRGYCQRLIPSGLGEGTFFRCDRRTIFDAPQEQDDAFHMAHRRNKRMWGDNLDNVQTECGSCHRAYHERGPTMQKPVPAKG